MKFGEIDWSVGKLRFRCRTKSWSLSIRRKKHRAQNASIGSRAALSKIQIASCALAHWCILYVYKSNTQCVHWATNERRLRINKRLNGKWACERFFSLGLTHYIPCMCARVQICIYRGALLWWCCARAFSHNRRRLLKWKLTVIDFFLFQTCQWLEWMKLPPPPLFQTGSCLFLPIDSWLRIYNIIYVRFQNMCQSTVRVERAAGRRRSVHAATILYSTCSQIQTTVKVKTLKTEFT